MFPIYFKRNCEDEDSICLLVDNGQIKNMIVNFLGVTVKAGIQETLAYMLEILRHGDILKMVCDEPILLNDVVNMIMNYDLSKYEFLELILAEGGVVKFEDFKTHMFPKFGTFIEKYKCLESNKNLCIRYSNVIPETGGNYLDPSITTNYTTLNKSIQFYFQ
uniref:Uncharacterized protein n=1 Tax=viral metagenome TaxID=1070528 RepID=A0A6C0EAU1_9ZZZZ